MPWFYYELTSVMGEVMALSSLVEAQLALHDAGGGIGRSQLCRAGASHGICLS